MILKITFILQHKTPVLLVLFSILCYTFFAYHVVRTDYITLLTLYSSLFFIFYKLTDILKAHIKLLTGLAFIFRALFILAIPNLSQDFYRFIWDGRMLLEGFNPYLHSVEFFINAGKFPVVQAQELYEGMGMLNASHFTNYPPLNQLCFAFAGLFSGSSILGSVVVLRLIIIAADFGTLYFGKKLLERLNLPVSNIFWYVLNPFIIIELTGNLHFEGVMIFFLIWSLYLLHSGKWIFAALVLGCSISVKLIPLMFLPLFYKWFLEQSIITNDVKQSVFIKEFTSSLTPRNDGKKWIPNFSGMRNLIVFYSIAILTTVLLFAPFYSETFILNYSKTVALWFQDFEFNGSLYYLAREFGYLFRGYNEIASIGKIIPVLVVIFVIIRSFLWVNKTLIQLITSMLFVLSFYFFTATTVHPWYIATLIILAVFNKYKFPLVWSFVIILSYLAYINLNNSENLWIIALEYAVVYGVFIWEVFIKKNCYIELHKDNTETRKGFLSKSAEKPGHSEN